MNEYIYNPTAATLDYNKNYSLTTKQLYEEFKKLLEDRRVMNAVWIYRGNSGRLQRLFSKSLNKISTIDSLILIALE
jgi:hypothetical protein